MSCLIGGFIWTGAKDAEPAEDRVNNLWEDKDFRAVVIVHVGLIIILLIVLVVVYALHPG